MTNWMHSFFLAGALLGATLVARAQDVADSNFGLRLSGSSSQRIVSLGDSKSRVIQLLGPPTKTSRYYAETENAWATVLHYGSNKLDFTHDILDLVQLNDARLTVGRPGAAGFHVGSVLPKMPPAAKVPLAFGTFRVAYQPGKSRNLNYNAISFGHMKTAKGQVLDVLYEIQYDQQGRVAHIFLDQSYD
ncbi:hypothetical protein A0257_10660 [Hymenobacter psoromatis]|nr:hypothetical protein A0257_10660 [Hymenobacter psoromatis]